MSDSEKSATNIEVLRLPEVVGTCVIAGPKGTGEYVCLDLWSSGVVTWRKYEPEEFGDG